MTNTSLGFIELRVVAACNGAQHTVACSTQCVVESVFEIATTASSIRIHELAVTSIGDAAGAYEVITV